MGDKPLLGLFPKTLSSSLPSKDSISDDEIEVPIVVRTWLQGTVQNLFNLKSFRNGVLRGGFPEEMSRYVRQWIAACDACQEMSVRRSVVQAHISLVRHLSLWREWI